jgi:TetR/AcrR family transcriptional regulator, fatty acid biosynthesis regulator
MSTSRKVTKELTRQKLIEATLQVLHEQGPAALTTGRIAAAAGLAQPTFYVHFTDMEDALTQAATAVEERLLVRLRELRDALSVSDPDEALRNIFRSTLKAFMLEPQLTQLYLRHRHDVDSPLGRRFREGTDRARRELAEDLRRVGLRLPNLDAHAEAVVGMVLGVLEGLLEGRLGDREQAVEALAHIGGASLRAAVDGGASPAGSAGA